MVRIIIFFLLIPFYIKAQSVGEERYDKSLSRLNNVDKLNEYIDSCAAVRKISPLSKEDVFLVNDIIEERFYHGYSYYTLEDNWIAFLAGKYVWDHLSAVVIPDDLLKHEMAACSQQAIVMMEVLKKRGYNVRKLGLQGHFILEAYYDANWHVFDPNKEPAYQGISHDSLDIFLKNGYLHAAYSKTETPEAVERMFSKREIGKVNKFPARNARIFHLITDFISQYFYYFILPIVAFLFYLRRRKANTRERALSAGMKKVKA